MTREPAITFRGALQILGHEDHKWLNRLDGVLGGVILASGVVPAIGAVWGWVDQKNEATGLLRRAMDAVSGRLTRTGGLARHELVVAAHTTLVLSAFFETLRFWLGEKFEEVAFTEAEKVRFGTGLWQRHGEPLVRHLYTADVPSPSATCGFEGTVHMVALWASTRSKSVGVFLQTCGFTPRLPDVAFDDAVAERYRSDYLALATTVPEFKVWADFAEHAATRTALTQLTDLLTSPVPEPPRRDLRALVGEINRAELTRPVIDVDIDGYGIDAVFPAVQNIFVTPHFRVMTFYARIRVGDDYKWHESSELNKNLDVVLARHFSTPDSTRLPLLLLGHPGAGKSLLTKVLAARLPESTYTVVRVPLRRVNADASISDQIQQALKIATHGRVSWPDLIDQSADAIRVVLLDGLDELLQATTNDRAGYLTDIVEFQRVEAALGKPVAVVVTSRTLVADRVRVPHGTPVLKLEEFDDDQIHDWLRVWHEVNNTTVTPEDVLTQGDLARQPLLLLMLTLYFTDPDTERPSDGLSTADLYRRLFITYARREVTKQAGRVLQNDELEEAIHTQLLRLSTAALGMFNRGRQFISEAELSADLMALGEEVPGGRLLGEFFFVHAAEANAGALRGYEFLHATFGEYLVAARVLEVLTEVAEGSFGRRRFHDPDDELLFALLSHQPLAIQRPILDFLAEHLDFLTEDDATDVGRTLELLISAHRQRRPPARHTDYRPLPPDTVRALAAYSANLVLLRVLSPGAVTLTMLWPDGEHDAWRATVNLWAAGLEAEAYRAVLTSISVVDGTIVLFENSGEPDETIAARLRGDRDAERRLQYGQAVLNESVYLDARNPERWEDAALSSMIKLITSGADHLFTIRAPDEVPLETKAAVAEVAHGLFSFYCTRWSRYDAEEFLRWLMTLRAPRSLSPFLLALANHRYPELLDSLRNNPDDDWTLEWRAMLRAATPEILRRLDVAIVAEYLEAVTPGIWPIAGGRGLSAG